MTMTTNIESIIPATRTLEEWVSIPVQAFRSKGIHINRPINITISKQNSKPRICSWDVEGVSTREGEKCWNITINHETLCEEPQTIFNALVEGVIHIACKEKGIKECADSGRHNKKFKDMAERLGCTTIDLKGSKGWMVDRVNGSLWKQCNEEFSVSISNFNNFAEARPAKEKKRRNGGGGMRAWICSSECATPRVYASAGVMINDTCGNCGNVRLSIQPMKMAETPTSEEVAEIKTVSEIVVDTTGYHISREEVDTTTIPEIAEHVVKNLTEKEVEVAEESPLAKLAKFLNL